MRNMKIEFENGSVIESVGRGDSIKSDRYYQQMRRLKAFCLDSECAYYYGEIDECMYGEPEIPDDWDKKCEQKGGNI